MALLLYFRSLYNSLKTNQQTIIMKRFLNLWFFLGLLLMTSCVAKKKFLELEQEKNSLSSSLDETRTQVTNLESEKATLTSEKQSLQSELSSAESNLVNSKGEVTSLKSAIEEKDESIKKLESEMDVVFKNVKTVMMSNDQSMREVDNKLYLVMNDPITFKSGSARIQKDDMEVLEKVATILKADTTIHYIIEGHTDNRPISNAQYKDNWDLSTRRSAAVAKQLAKLGVNPLQFTIAGRSDFMPVLSGEDLSKEDMENNRRVEFIALPNISDLYKKS